MLNRSSPCSLPQPIIRERRTIAIGGASVPTFAVGPWCLLGIAARVGAGALLNSMEDCVPTSANGHFPRRFLRHSGIRWEVTCRPSCRLSWALIVDWRLTTGMRQPLDCGDEALRGVRGDAD